MRKYLRATCKVEEDTQHKDAAQGLARVLYVSKIN